MRKGAFLCAIFSWNFGIQHSGFMQIYIHYHIILSWTFCPIEIVHEFVQMEKIRALMERYTTVKIIPICGEKKTTTFSLNEWKTPWLLTVIYCIYI